MIGSPHCRNSAAPVTGRRSHHRLWTPPSPAQARRRHNFDLRLTPLGGHPDRQVLAWQERMPVMGAKRRKYTPQYRQDAARLVIDTGRTIAEVARELGIGEQVLGRWVAIERARMVDPPAALDLNERAELERLRRENAELRMDREFLKKAAAFFATETGSSPNGPLS